MDYLLIASYIGTLAFAVSGVIIGIRKGLDLMGVFILSFLTSSGGGVLRDVLLDRAPLIFENQEIYILITIMVVVFKFLRSKEIIDKLEGTLAFRASDTIGLVAFAISGAQTAILTGHNLFVVMVMAFLTAVGGGVIRDILVNEVPEILKSGFYASVAVIIGLMLYLLGNSGIDEDISIPIVFITGTAIRLYAIKKKIQLPKI